MITAIKHFLQTGRHQLTAGPVDAVDVCSYAAMLDQTYRRLTETHA
jgi:hypothetical protein